MSKPKKPDPIAKESVAPPPLARVLSYGKRGDDVAYLQTLLRDQGYFQGSIGGNFKEITRDAVMSFQNSHLDQEGKYLHPDGIVGSATWWALHNPSGDPQRSFIKPTAPAEIQDGRREILEWFAQAHARGIHEIPDGSNTGDGVTEILKSCGIGPNPWCMAIQSHAEKEVFGDAPLGRMHAHVATFWNEAMKWGRAFRKGSYKPIPGDIAIWNYRDPSRPSLVGPGHAARVATVSANADAFNTFGGNEGNRLKFGLRHTRETALVGFVNLFRDEANPPEFRRGVVHAPEFILTEKSSR